MVWLRSWKAGILALALVFLPGFALAQVTPQSTGLSQAAQGTGLQNACANNPQTCVAQLVGNIIRFGLGFVEVLLFLYLLYGGFLWMTSGGDEKGTVKAKTMIKNAVIGLVIISTSYVVASYAVNSLSQVVS